MTHPAMLHFSPRISENLQRIVVDALQHLDCAVIYLFGSYGGPDERPSSDIDIAFLPSHPVTPLECFDLTNLLTDQLGKPVDLINLLDSSTVFAKEVLRTGTPLWIGDGATHENFEMRNLSDYARLNEERQAILTQ